MLGVSEVLRHGMPAADCCAPTTCAHTSIDGSSIDDRRRPLAVAAAAPLRSLACFCAAAVQRAGVLVIELELHGPTATAATSSPPTAAATELAG
jgi:hypothetical protein